MEIKEILQLAAQVGVPAIILFWIIKFSFPRMLDVIEKMVTSFREEMTEERKNHSNAIDRFFEIQHDEHAEIKNKIEEIRYEKSA